MSIINNTRATFTTQYTFIFALFFIPLTAQAAVQQIGNNIVSTQSQLDKSNAGSFLSETSIELLLDHKEHIPQLSEIWYQSLGKKQKELSVEQFRKNLANHYNKDTIPLTLIAFDNNKPIGMVSLVDSNEIKFYHEFAPRLRHLVVEQAYRRQGIGKKLIDAVKQKAHELGYKKIYLIAGTAKLHKFYASLGWQDLINYGASPVLMEITLE